MSSPDDDAPRSILTDRALWSGLLGIVVGLVVAVLLFNYSVMPIWTRHDASIAVPDVREMTTSEAERTLVLAGLDGEVREQPFNPNLDPDLVVDQSPSAATLVKPGRRIYYYVNASPKELVAMPDVVSLSEGAARPQIEDAGLAVGRVELDSVRTPFENTVTRQLPAAGRQVPRGTRVQLWLSRGVDTSRRVEVPDVVGMTPAAARGRLREAGFWVASPRATGDRVTAQDPARGTLLNPGKEVTILAPGRPQTAEATPDSSAE
jgi:beta-lactam-binding protein with PASTA domain